MQLLALVAREDVVVGGVLGDLHLKHLLLMTSQALILPKLGLHFVYAIFQHLLPLASLLGIPAISERHSLATTTNTDSSKVVFEKIVLTLGPLESQTMILLTSC